MAADDTDKLIRAAVKALIVSAQPNAIVWPYDALSHKRQEWPGLFRTSTIVQGWIIKETGLAATRKNTVLDRQVLSYDVWGFYGFRQGTETDNSDDEFSAIRNAVYEAIRLSNHLSLDGVVERHELLQFNKGSIGTIDCGEETLHFALGELTVHLCC